jgi:hypothetical protein
MYIKPGYFEREALLYILWALGVVSGAAYHSTLRKL